MKKIAFAAFVVALVGVVGLAQAADKNDPTGTWKWKTKFGKGDNAKEIERSMKLVYKNGKLTGTVSGFGKDAPDTKIEDGMFKDGELSFNVTTERKGNKFTTKYSGKLSDDTIKGKMTSERNGKERTQEWEAKRAGKVKD
jgi:hypothetical protein